MLCTQLHTLLCAYSHPEATRLTTMEVEVDELWTSTVTKIPTTSPATGLDSTTLSWKMSPATLPGLICSPHRHTQTHAHILTHTYTQTTGLRLDRVAKSNVKQDSRCLFSEHSKRSQMRLSSKLYSTTLVGCCVFCSDSLICQTWTG